ncbi:DUF4868 domain-containing protein [Bacillus altitudinis]|uniref:Kiwa anti-phage protein KwaB-like domain-containing protein n=1 Tax=Bacillus altitudinis TaxID=293387 RepID=UPI001C232083|nr:Kiwa anti-phage protein KwaB-like domain-containing protein [Bacillus altitudinis]MBU8970357.1 DUF4868 domain-containing protein [Bacillus altitudinis]MBY0185469.1 DUF4868 domain-containing protein [Bacillus aerophilus]MCY7628208.1 DUF4868 domain-containing protein [Bacillus altitudinis]MDX2364140.1 DUF4868 domain-containing protein [Bacillus altitudinis]
MIDRLTQINDYLDSLSATPNFQLFIIGSILKEGTATIYDDTEPAEILTDVSVRDWVFTGTKNILNTLTEYELININDTDEPGEYFKRYLQLDTLSQLEQWKSHIENEIEHENARGYINNDRFKPKCIIAKLTVLEEDIYFIKVINESVLLKKRTILKYIATRDGYVIDENRDKKLFLDDQWDGIIFNQHVILLKENKILNLFRYYEKFREAAQNVVNQLESLNLLSGTENLNEFIQSTVSLQKKLAKAATYQIDQIRTDRINELINQGMINLNLNSEGKIECTTKEEARVVIDVLLDNFVASLITDEKYRVHNKSKIQS